MTGRLNGVAQQAPDVTNISCINKTIIISLYLYDCKTRIEKKYFIAEFQAKKNQAAWKEKKWPPNLFICEDALVYFLDIIVI